MAALWFIEAQKDEAWNDASHAFTDWLVETQSPSTLEPFGFSEGDELAHNGLSFFCFCFPSRYGEKIALFGEWAKTTGRRFGWTDGRLVHFSSGGTVLLPPDPVTPDLPWLKQQ